NFSISLWVRYCVPQGSFTGLIEKEDAYRLQVGGDDHSDLWITSSSGFATIDENPTLLADGIWHHIVGVANSYQTGALDSLILYVDGVIIGVHDYGLTNPYVADFSANTADITLGFAEARRYYQGALDDV